jgi:hypothetical protein
MKVDDHRRILHEFRFRELMQSNKDFNSGVWEFMRKRTPKLSSSHQSKAHQVNGQMKVNLCYKLGTQIGTQKGAERAVEAVDAVRIFPRKFSAC